MQEDDGASRDVQARLKSSVRSSQERRKPYWRLRGAFRQDGVAAMKIDNTHEREVLQLFEPATVKGNDVSFMEYTPVRQEDQPGKLDLMHLEMASVEVHMVETEARGDAGEKANIKVTEAKQDLQPSALDLQLDEPESKNSITIC